jgi:regulator of ribosome biosynthesis
MAAKKTTHKGRILEEEATTTSSSDTEEDVDGGDDNDEEEGDSGSEGESDEQMMDEDSEEEEGESGDEEESDDDDNDDDNDDDDDDEDEEEDDLEEENADNKSSIGVGGGGGGGEQCTFDLHNLLAFNTHQINVAELYQPPSSTKIEKLNNKEWYATPPTIEATAGILPGVINESLLLAKAAEGTTQLLRELWRLPTEKTDVGSLARLPGASSGGEATKLPRSLPPPPPKQKSKWEEFAAKRGIAPQTKRSRKVYDESTGEWKHLTGSLSNKANAGPESWPIIEVKKNDDPNQDPWERLREEKKARTGKNTVSRMKNAERAGMLEHGSANRLMKDTARLVKQRAASKEKLQKQGLVAPAGLPLDMAKGGKDDTTMAKRGKPSTTLALKATQISTASLGRFDKLREGEPERKAQLSKNISDKKRKHLEDSTGTNKKFLQSEAQKSSDILSRVINGGSSSKERERDVRKGKYAKGETAYDYEFDDGLGAGSFRKKKGRAGVGKMKKMTKKRIK